MHLLSVQGFSGGIVTVSSILFNNREITLFDITGEKYLSYIPSYKNFKRYLMVFKKLLFVIEIEFMRMP